ncbi:hypothetical protein Tco_0115454, partial [Tanacetum coccineum]
AHVNSVRAYVNSVRANVNTCRAHVNSVRPNVTTGRAHVNSVRTYVNSVRAHVNSVRPNVNTRRANVNSVRQNVNSVRSNVNIVRPKQPVPTSNSNSLSLVRPQVNKFNQRSNFSKSHSPVRRPIVRKTAKMPYSRTVKGNWGTAVKTSAGYNWRNTRPNSNCNSGSNFVQTVNAKGPQGRPKPEKAWVPKINVCTQQTRMQMILRKKISADDLMIVSYKAVQAYCSKKLYQGSLLLIQRRGVFLDQELQNLKTQEKHAEKALPCKVKTCNKPPMEYQGRRVQKMRKPDEWIASSFNLEYYSDSDSAGKLDRKSTTCVVNFLGTKLISCNARTNYSGYLTTELNSMTLQVALDKVLDSKSTAGNMVIHDLQRRIGAWITSELKTKSNHRYLEYTITEASVRSKASISICFMDFHVDQEYRDFEEMGNMGYPG